MQSKEKSNLVFVRLFPGENVNDKLKEACKINKVKSAVVISGIGQLKKAQVGYFRKKDDYNPQIFNKPMEILSLTGNICTKENDYLQHLHVVLGDEHKKAFGGHFVDGTVSVTAEIVILKSNINVKRTLNKKTGLYDLDLE